MVMKHVKWLILCAVCLVGLQAKIVYALPVNEEINIEDDIVSYEECISESDISLEDKQMLLNDEAFRERYERMAG